jgi:hypothetical protein
MERLTGSFQAIGSDGQTYTVEVWTDFIDTGTLDDPHSETPGMQSLRTSAGEHLNYLGKGEYKMVGRDIILRSTDPNAP